MGKLSKFYNMLGNNKKERFFRFLLLLVTIGIILMFIINIGYDKKQGCYWKPADVHINKKVGNSHRTNSKREEYK